MTERAAPTVATFQSRAIARLVASRRLRTTAQVGFLAVIVGAYTVALAVNVDLTRVLPTIPALVGGLGGLIASAQFWQAVLHTLACAAVGLLISTVGGAAIGGALAAHRLVAGSTSFLVDFMRTIPALALIPVALLVLGPTPRMEVTLIVLTAIWPVIVQVYHGIQNIPHEYLDTARSYRLTSWYRIAYVLAPALGPVFGTAVRFSAILCLLLAVGTELLAIGRGLGFLVGFYQQANRIADVYAVVLVVGLLGVLVNSGLLAIERRVFSWNRRTEGVVNG